MKKICENCGAEFDCLHNDIANCHCASIILNDNQKLFLKNSFSDCLCNKCLKQVSENNLVIHKKIF